MDWFPLYNSIRIALISTVIIFFLGIFAAYYIAKAPRLVKGLLDVVLTLPLVLPPTVVGWLLLRLLGPRRLLGSWFLENFGLKLTMNWWSAIFATSVVIFPLMYRTARGAFEAFDETLAHSARTLGLSDTYIFWRIRIPWGFLTLTYSGASGFPAAVREFLREPCCPLPGHWANTAPPP